MLSVDMTEYFSNDYLFIFKDTKISTTKNNNHKQWLKSNNFSVYVLGEKYLLVYNFN